MNKSNISTEHFLKEDLNSFQIMVFKNGSVHPYFMPKELYEEYIQTIGPDVKSFNFVETWVSSKTL